MEFCHSVYVTQTLLIPRPHPVRWRAWEWRVTYFLDWYKLSHDSHDSHMTLTWLSHDSHMNLTTFTWLSHDSHMTITWLSHDSHMTLTWLSHDSHMTCSIDIDLHVAITVQTKGFYKLLLSPVHQRKLNKWYKGNTRRPNTYNSQILTQYCNGWSEFNPSWNCTKCGFYALCVSARFSHCLQYIRWMI